MSFKHFLFIVNAGALLFCGVVFSQIEKFESVDSSDKPRILVEAESIKVIAAEDFPANLACDIYVGQKRDLPWFSIEGKLGIVQDATIRLIDGTHSDAKRSPLSILDKGVITPSVSAIRKDTVQESYVLSFFSEDREGKTFALFDFNLDGSWDVKLTPTKEQKAFIFLDGLWIEVNSIEDLRSATPKAISEENRFEFKDTWKRSAGESTEDSHPRG